MPYKGKAPLTISSIQPCCPGLQIDSISKEVPIFSSGPSPGQNYESPSSVVVSSFHVQDARGNKLNLVSKRSKQLVGRQASAAEKEADVEGRMNETNFYLHYSDFFHTCGVSIPKAWSIKAPQSGGRGGGVFTLLLSDLCAGTGISVRGGLRKLDYYDTVAAVRYLAEFHSVCWERKDEDSTVFEIGGGLKGREGGGGGGGGGDEDEGSWGDLGDKLETMKGGLLRRLETGLQRSRKHKTIIHGSFIGRNLAFYPSSNPSAYSTCASFDFKMAGRGYGVYDLAMLLCESVDPDLMVRDQREEEFLEIYFHHLGESLRARKRPPLPPGYNKSDTSSMYELCLLLYCATFVAKGKGAGGGEGGYEYATWRCQYAVQDMEREGGKGGEDLTESSWGNIINQRYPLR